MRMRIREQEIEKILLSVAGMEHIFDEGFQLGLLTKVNYNYQMRAFLVLP